MVHAFYEQNLTSGVFVDQCINRDDVDICESKSTN